MAEKDKEAQKVIRIAWLSVIGVLDQGCIGDGPDAGESEGWAEGDY